MVEVPRNSMDCKSLEIEEKLDQIIKLLKAIACSDSNCKETICTGCKIKELGE